MNDASVERTSCNNQIKKISKILRWNVENCVSKIKCLQFHTNQINSFQWIDETQMILQPFSGAITIPKNDLCCFLFLEKWLNAAIKHMSNSIVRLQCVSNKLEWNCLLHMLTVCAYVYVLSSQASIRKWSTMKWVNVFGHTSFVFQWNRRSKDRRCIENKWVCCTYDAKM